MNYYELSEIYEDVVVACFISPTAGAMFTFVDGTTKAFDKPSEAEKYLKENRYKMKARKRK